MRGLFETSEVTVALTRLLRLGSRGADVQHVQTALNIIGFPFYVYGTDLPSRLPQLRMDGIFGHRTQARVWEFQGDRGLAQDTIVGPRTYGAIRAMGIPGDVNPEYFGAFAIDDFRRRMTIGILSLTMSQIRLIKWIPGFREEGILGREYWKRR